MMDRHIRLIIMLLLVNTVITAIYLFWDISGNRKYTGTVDESSCNAVMSI